MQNLTASILIRTKNEAPFIAKALELVSNQTWKHHEIIVVDSGSTDGTVEIVRQWSDVTLIQMPASEFTFGRSLNLGFKAATGDVVIALSAHAFPCDQNWLENLMKHFEDSRIAGVYGRQLPHSNAWPPVQRDSLVFYGEEPRIQVDPNNFGDRVFSNANSAIRRICWEKYPFDEALTGCEDQEWAWAMLKQGYQIVYEPEATVYHSHNEPLNKVCNRTYRETLALNELYDRELSLYQVARSWARWVVRDIRFIRETKQDWKWLFRVPIYRAFAAYGCLKASSLHGLLSLPAFPQKIGKPLEKSSL
ncbi:MAG TPA: glycosyltransferase family 2 protein [Coleofasciculaceae cyanobacterium]